MIDRKTHAINCLVATNPRAARWQFDKDKKLPRAAFFLRHRLFRFSYFCGMEKLHIGQRIELTITDYAFGGKGISRITTAQGEKVVFVQNALPGQRLLARVVKSKKRYVECKLVKVLERAGLETDSSYQDIPGAPYTRLPVKSQQELKTTAAFNLYHRIGKVQNIESVFEGWIDSPATWHYRNKMEYSFSSINSDPETDVESDRFSLGFKRRGSWWAVENLNADSGLFDADFENNLHRLRTWFESTGHQAWNPRQRHGYFKNLVVRKSFYQNQLMLNLITGNDDAVPFNDEAFIEQCLQIFGDRVAGIFHSVNDSTGDRSSIDDAFVRHIYGQQVLVEELLSLKFEIGIKSFFQPNPACAAKLYSRALDYISRGYMLPSNQVILDLFCGTGTISQLLAQRYPNSKVIGVDIEQSAIEDARQNAIRNHLDTPEFYAGDVGRFLTDRPDLAGAIGAAVLDPPRGGIAPKTLRKIIRLNAQKIVYISCNPATQARDCEILSDAGYRLLHLTLVDQFPHTAHVEAVALFENTRKS